MKIGDEIDYTKMCLGSEERGTLKGDVIECSRCHQDVPTPFPNFNLVPVHEVPDNV